MCILNKFLFFAWASWGFLYFSNEGVLENADIAYLEVWYLKAQSSNAELSDVRETGRWGVSSCQSAKNGQSLIFDSEAVI